MNLIKRRCPNCKESIDFKTVIYPLLAGGKRRIVCNSCDMPLSKKQSEYTFLRYITFPLIYVIGKLPRFFGFNFSLTEDIIFIVVLMFILLILFYAYTPLKVTSSHKE